MFGVVFVELGRLGRVTHARGRGRAAQNQVGDHVEIAGTDFALVTCRRLAIGLGVELGLLQFGIGRHAAVGIAARQFIHAVVQLVEAGSVKN